MTSTPEADVNVALLLQGDFEPEELTSRLELSPTRAFLKGDRIGSRIRQCSTWSLDSDSAIDADSLAPHLDWLLARVEPRAAALSELRAEGIDGIADCSWASGGVGGGRWVPPEAMPGLGALPLPLVISFYSTEALRAPGAEAAPGAS